MICLLVFYVGLAVLYFLTISEVAVGILDTNCSLFSKSVYENSKDLKWSHSALLFYSMI